MPEQRYLAAPSPYLRGVAVIMLETGMRPGEIYRLRKEDVELNLRSLFVQTGKTSNATRHIPLTDRAFQTLARRVQRTTTS